MYGTMLVNWVMKWHHPVKMYGKYQALNWLGIYGAMAVNWVMELHCPPKMCSKYQAPNLGGDLLCISKSGNEITSPKNE